MKNTGNIKKIKKNKSKRAAVASVLALSATAIAPLALIEKQKADGRKTIEQYTRIVQNEIASQMKQQEAPQQQVAQEFNAQQSGVLPPVSTPATLTEVEIQTGLTNLAQAIATGTDISTSYDIAAQVASHISSANGLDASKVQVRNTADVSVSTLPISDLSTKTISGSLWYPKNGVSVPANQANDKTQFVIVPFTVTFAQSRGEIAATKVLAAAAGTIATQTTSSSSTVNERTKDFIIGELGLKSITDFDASKLVLTVDGQDVDKVTLANDQTTKAFSLRYPNNGVSGTSTRVPNTLTFDKSIRQFALDAYFSNIHASFNVSPTDWAMPQSLSRADILSFFESSYPIPAGYDKDQITITSSTGTVTATTPDDLSATTSTSLTYSFAFPTAAGTITKSMQLMYHQTYAEAQGVSYFNSLAGTTVAGVAPTTATLANLKTWLGYSSLTAAQKAIIDQITISTNGVTASPNSNSVSVSVELPPLNAKDGATTQTQTANHTKTLTFTFTTSIKQNAVDTAVTALQATKSNPDSSTSNTPPASISAAQVLLWSGLDSLASTANGIAATDITVSATSGGAAATTFTIGDNAKTITVYVTLPTRSTPVALTFNWAHTRHWNDVKAKWDALVAAGVSGVAAPTGTTFTIADVKKWLGASLTGLGLSATDSLTLATASVTTLGEEDTSVSPTLDLTVDGESIGSSAIAISFANSIKSAAYDTWWSLIKSSYTITSSVPASLGLSDVLGVLGITGTADGRGDLKFGVASSTPGTGAVTISDMTATTLSVTLSIPSGKTGVTARQTKTVTFSYGSSQNEGWAKRWFDAIPASINAPAADVAREVDLTYFTSILGTVKDASNNVIQKPAASLTLSSTVPGDTDLTATVTISYPTDGQVGTTTLLPSKTVVVHFSKTKQQVAIETLWNSKVAATGNKALTGTGTSAPASITRTEILALLGISAMPHAADLTLTVGTTAQTGDITINSGSKTLDFTIAMPATSNNGHALSQAVRITWPQSVDQAKALAWFNGLTGVSTGAISASGEFASKTIALADFKRWAGTTYTTNKPGTADVTVAVKTAATNTGYTAVITVSFPDDGKTSTTLLTKDITVTFSKTIRQKTIEGFWNPALGAGAGAKAVSRAAAAGADKTTPPASISLSDVLGWVGITSSAADYSNTIAMLDANKAAASSITIGDNVKSVTVWLSIPAQSPDTFAIEKEVTITWDQTRDEKAVAAWWTALPTAITLTNPVFPPQAAITVDNFKTWMGTNNSPSTLKNLGLAVLPTGTTFPTPTETDKTVSLTLQYPSTGKVGSTPLASRTFVFTFTKTYQQSGIDDWWKTLPTGTLTDKGGATAPTTVSISQILTWLGQTPTTTPKVSPYRWDQVELHEGSTATGAKVASATFAANEKSKTYTLYIVSNGVSFSHTITLTWSSTRNEAAAKKWFDALSSKGADAAHTIATIPAAGTLALAAGSINDWINNIGAAKPTGITGDLLIKTASGNEKTELGAKDSSTTFTLQFPKNGIDDTDGYLEKSFTVFFAKSPAQKAIETWWNAHVSAATAITNPSATANDGSRDYALATVSRAQVLSWLGVATTADYIGDVKMYKAATATGTATDSITLAADEKSLTITLEIPSYAPSASAQTFTKTITISWDKSKDMHDASTYMATFANPTASINEAVTQTITITEVMGWITHGTKPTSLNGMARLKVGTTGTTTDTADSLTGTILFPKDGQTSSAADADCLSFDFTIHFAKTRRQEAITKWWNTKVDTTTNTQLSGSGHDQIVNPSATTIGGATDKTAITSVTPAIIKSWLGITAADENQGDIVIKYNGVAVTSAITIDNDVKTITFTIEITSGASTHQISTATQIPTTLTKTFTVKWENTRNELAAKNYWDGLAVPTTAITGTMPASTTDATLHRQITIDDIKGWLTGSAKPTGTTFALPANLAFKTGFTAPTPSNTDGTVTVSLQFPKNGVDSTGGYWSGDFTFTFAKSLKQVKVDTWWTSILAALDRTSATNAEKGIAPEHFTAAKVLEWFGITASSQGAQEVQIYAEGTTAAAIEAGTATPLTRFDIDTTTKVAKFVLSAPTYNPATGAAHYHVKDITATWTDTRVEAQLKAILFNSLTVAPATKNGHPTVDITLADLKSWIGYNSITLPKLPDGSTVNPVFYAIPATLATNAALPAGSQQFTSLTPKAGERVFKFRILVKANGDSGTEIWQDVTIQWAESRQDYLDGLAVPQVSTTSKTGDGVMGATSVSANPSMFGVVEAVVNTSGLPLTLSELSAGLTDPQRAHFRITTGHTGLKVTAVKSATLIPDPTSSIQARQRVVLTLTYLDNTTRDVTIDIDYAHADIANFVNAANMQTQINTITAEGNTHAATVKIPKAVVDYFNSNHMNLSIVFKAGVESAVTYDATKAAGSFYEITVPAGVLSNDINHRTNDFTIKLTMQSNFEDHGNLLTTAPVSAVHKSLTWPVYLDIDSTALWKTTAAPTGLLSVTAGANVNTNNWALSDTNNNANSHFNVEVRWVPASGTPESWISVTAFNASAKHFWDQYVAPAGTRTTYGDFAGHVEMRLAPISSDYVLSATDGRVTSMPIDMRDAITKVIDPGTTAGTGANTPIMKEIMDDIATVLNAVTITHTNAIAWGTLQTLLDTYATNHHIAIKYATTATPTAADFTATLPVNLPTYKTDRHLWIQVTALTGYVLIGGTTPVKEDVAPSIPKVATLKAYVTVPAVTVKTITGTTYSPTVTLTPLASKLPVGLKYEYSVDDGAHWLTETAFEAAMNNIHVSKSQFKYRIVSTDASLYVASTTTEGNFDVSSLKTYIDVAALTPLLSTISFAGAFGDKVYIQNLPATLAADKLDQFRLKLQIKIVGSTGVEEWVDVSDHVENVDGHPSIKISDKLIPSSTSAAYAQFRLVPYLTDGAAPTAGHRATTGIVTTAPNSPMASFETASSAVLSAHVDADGKFAAVQLQLPVKIATSAISAADITFGTAPGAVANTKNMVITIAKTALANIQATSPTETQKDFWNKLVYLFTIDDGKGSARYGFTADTFQKWMQGDYATGALPQVWEVADASGTPYPQEGMKLVTLPVTLKTPNWNGLDMSSLNVRWGTKTTRDYLAQPAHASERLYVGTNSAVVSLGATFQAQIRKWFDVAAIMEATRAVYISGNTHTYTIDLSHKIASASTVDTSIISAANLATWNLKRQFSIDGTTWSDTQPAYDTWAKAITRVLYMRVVPTVGFAAGTPTYSTSAAVGSVFLFDSTNAFKAQFNNAQTETNGDRSFRIYVNAPSANFAHVIVTGTQYKLLGSKVADGVDESVDTGTENYGQIELQYLYGGQWLNKAALIAAVNANAGQSAKGTITFPADFDHDKVQVRWHLTGASSNYVLEGATTADKTVTAPGDADASGLKTFVNLWNIQSPHLATINNPAGGSVSYSGPVNTHADAAGTVTSGDYTLTGSLNSATLTMAGTLLTPTFLATNHLKLQYSTAQYPSAGVSGGSDWKDAGSGTQVFTGVAIDNQHKSLWLRIVSTDATTVAPSSYANGGNDQANVIPMKINTSSLKFTITTTHVGLEKLLVTGTTQALASSDATFGVAKFLDGTSSLITYQREVNGALVAISSTADKRQWVIDNGLALRWKVTQTRSGQHIVNGKTVNAGDSVEFDSFSQLQSAVASGNLNFDSSSLQVQWSIVGNSAKTNIVSDSTWVKPTSAAQLINILYTRDYVTLNATSLVATGNSIKTTLTDAANLATQLDALAGGAGKTHQVKIQYSLDYDANNPTQATWTDTKPTTIANGQTRQLHIRLAPIDALHQISDAAGAQITAIDVSNVKTGIALGTNLAAWIAELNSLGFATGSFTGLGSFILAKTVGSHFTATHTGTIAAHDVANVLGQITAQNGQKVGHWEYSTNNTNWFTTINAAMHDYFGSGLRAFDKDRDQSLSVRYVLSNTEKTKSSTSTGYTFTDDAGNDVVDASMVRAIPISSLTQYLYIDNTQAAIRGVTTGTAGASWRQLGNHARFLPTFVAGATTGTANLGTKGMQFQGQSLSSTTSTSLFAFDVNPYSNTLDTTRRDAADALAPRHTHFEYAYSSTRLVDGWSQGTGITWSRTAPQNMALTSEYKAFAVKIVPDAGYTLPIDAFARGDQNWQREYNVIILTDTESITAFSLEYAGFDATSVTAGRGIVRTDNVDGDYLKGNPLITIKKSGTEWNDYKTSGSLLLEWRVTDDRGRDIAWIDNDGHTHNGWSEPVNTVPAADRVWFGHYPTSLRNGNIVRVRFVAKNGYKIIDSQSVDRDPSGYQSHSREIAFAPVTGLTNELVVPDGLHIYDTKFQLDYNGSAVTPVQDMPTITFSGTEGHGGMAINPGNIPNFSSRVDFEVQVLRPRGKWDSVTMKPLAGFDILDKNGVLVKRPDPVVNTTGLTADWDEDIDDIPNTWVPAVRVNWLRVGDSVRIRLVAKTGSAFRWEDEKSAWDDIDTTPKSRSHFAFNSGGVLAESGTNGHVQVTPLAVTGLTVNPPIKPSALTLIYSNKEQEKIQGNAVVELSQTPVIGDKWHWIWLIIPADKSKPQPNPRDSRSWSLADAPLPTDLYNGDQIMISPVLDNGYAFDASYLPIGQDVHTLDATLTISGLKEKIDSTGMARPEIHFSGYQGFGTISALTPINNGHAYGAPDANGIASPTVVTGNYSGARGIRWEYLVYHKNPRLASEGDIAAIVPTPTLPTQLEAGWYVKVILAPVDPNDVVWPSLYSQQNGYDESKLESFQKGWVEVTGLKLNPVNIGLENRGREFDESGNLISNVAGYIGRVELSTLFTKNSLDEKSCTIEYSLDGHTWTTNVNDKNNPTPFQKMINGSTFSMRVRAANNVQFDQHDPAFTTAGGTVPKGYYAEVDPVTHSVYLRNTEWDGVIVKGLKTYLNVDRVVIEKPDPNTGNLKDVYADLPKLEDSHISGLARLIAPVIRGLDTVVDNQGSATDGHGTVYKNLIQARYRVQRIDPDTGQMSPEQVTTSIPDNLSNGDSVTVELYSTDNQYKLSKPIMVTIKVSGLTDVIPRVEFPRFVFVGISGAGRANVTNGQPRGFRWEFATWYGDHITEPTADQLMWSGHSYVIKADGTVAEVVTKEDATNPDHMIIVEKATGTKVGDVVGGVWVALDHTNIFKEIPTGTSTDLSNGDRVRARLVNVLAGTVAVDPTRTPIISEWTMVTGLTDVLDLANLKIAAFNEQSPYEPNQGGPEHAWTYALKVVGQQQGSARIDVDATLDIEEGKIQLKDVNGKLIANAEKLQWEFAVDTKAETDETTRWSLDLPMGLRNGEFIHARLSVRPGVSNLIVKNSKVFTLAVPKLTDPDNIDSKTIVYVSVAVSSAVVLGGSAGLLHYLRTRRKLNYKIKPKM